MYVDSATKSLCMAQTYAILNFLVQYNLRCQGKEVLQN